MSQRDNQGRYCPKGEKEVNETKPILPNIPPETLSKEPTAKQETNNCSLTIKIVISSFLTILVIPYLMMMKLSIYSGVMHYSELFSQKNCSCEALVFDVLNHVEMDYFSEDAEALLRQYKKERENDKMKKNSASKVQVKNEAWKLATDMIKKEQAEKEALRIKMKLKAKKPRNVTNGGYDEEDS